MAFLLFRVKTLGRLTTVKRPVLSSAVTMALRELPAVK